MAYYVYRLGRKKPHRCTNTSAASERSCSAVALLVLGSRTRALRVPTQHHLLSVFDQVSANRSGLRAERTKWSPGTMHWRDAILNMISAVRTPCGGPQRFRFGGRLWIPAVQCGPPGDSSRSLPSRLLGSLRRFAQQASAASGPQPRVHSSGCTQGRGTRRREKK